MIWSASLPVNPSASVTVMVKLNVMAALGVLEITPLELLRAVPVGKGPDVAANL